MCWPEHRVVPLGLSVWRPPPARRSVRLWHQQRPGANPIASEGLIVVRRWQQSGGDRGRADGRHDGVDADTADHTGTAVSDRANLQPGVDDALAAVSESGGWRWRGRRWG
jgi:hypothetical protein